MDKIKKAQIYGKIGYYLTKIIWKTMDIKIITNENYKENSKYIFAFWHNMIFLPMVEMVKNGAKIVNMVSPSKDGEIIATMLEKYGYELIRSSSNKDSVKGLVMMLKKIKEGYSGGFAVDGPTGPALKVKQGVIYSAQKSGIEIVPLAGAFSSKWILKKSWDKLQIPKPFSKAVYIIGEPFKVFENEDIEKCCEKLENILNLLTLEAEKILNNKK